MIQEQEVFLLGFAQNGLKQKLLCRLVIQREKL